MWGPIGALLLVLVAQLAALLALNRGQLVFTVDDAYIHLALAENLMTGHFGVNPGEASAPASSVLWPLLLAPVAGSALGPWMVWLLEGALAVAFLAVVGRIAVLSIEPGDALCDRLVVAGVLLACIPLTNLVALVFQGMEHVLQLLLCALIVLGLLVDGRQGRSPAWLWLAIFAAPLVRYECLVVSGCALLLLLGRGRRAGALITGAAIAMVMGAHALLLRSLDLGPLPTSVVAKAGFGGAARLLTRWLDNLHQAGGLLLAGVGAACGGLALRRDGSREGRPLLALAAVVCLVQLCIGRVGSMDRYQVYATSVGLLALLYARGPVLLAWARGGRWPALAATVAAGLLATAPHLYYGAFAFLYSHEMYLQQFQMSRFAREVLHAPVAVNDLGLASYRNDAYVLDLWGLASREALALRRESGSPEWMETLADRHGVQAVMIYDSWFPQRPAAWVRVAELRMRKLRPGSGREPVAIYARSAADARTLAERLVELGQRLPPDAWLAVPGAGGPDDRPRAAGG